MAVNVLIGPEPALGIPTKVAREVIRDWTSRKHEEHWQSMHGQRQAKGSLKKEKKKKTVQRRLGSCSS